MKIVVENESKRKEVSDMLVKGVSALPLVAAFVKTDLAMVNAALSHAGPNDASASIKDDGRFVRVMLMIPVERL